jgi:hypothetical protein
MAGEARREQLKTILRRTLNEQLAAAGTVDSDGNTCRLSGPWRTFFDETSAAWDGTTRLNHELYLDLRGKFDDNLVREALLAAADVKISRTSLTDEKIGLLRMTADRHGFEVVIGQGKWAVCADRGKGGWVNRGRRVGEAGEAGVVRNVYIASDSTLGETGRLLDEAGEDDLFGALLGIPACCRESFQQRKHLAARKQFDFVPYTLENTAGAMPYDWRLNCAAQYFGLSLLSFFPCSFRCPAAAEVADKTLQMLARCDAAWADNFVRLQQSNVLYTESFGVHLFRARLCDGQISYEPEDLLSTEATNVTSLLRQGDRLEIIGKHEILIYQGPKQLGLLSGDDTCICPFN